MRYSRAARSTLLVAVLFIVSPIANAAAGYDPERTFQTICAACHNPTPAPRAMSREAMTEIPPERIYKALSNGVMAFFALPLTADERLALAKHVSQVEWHAAAGDDLSEKLRQCSDAEKMNAQAWQQPHWSGWSVDLNNSRYQGAAFAGIDEPSLAQLELKWAFGFAGAATVGTQPAVVGGRVFIGSPEHRVYALDAVSGCSHWRFDTHGSVRGTPSVVQTPTGPVLYISDRAAWVYAIDANSGTLLWEHHADLHPAAMSTSSVVVHEGRVYVSVASFEENDASAANYECCTFRGSVVALNAADGAVLWKTYVIPELPSATGLSPHGVATHGPAGAGVWSPVTVDAKRGLLYVTTGDAYSRPASKNSDAVLALKIDSGEIAWSWQATPDDAYTNACLDEDTHPEILAACGPDLDFGSSAILRSLPDGSDILLAGQKSGVLHALNPDDGALLWQERLSPGGIIGGIEWGMSADDTTIYVPISDVWENTDEKGAAGGVIALDFATREKRWERSALPLTCLETRGCVAGQPQAATSVPGLLFSGSMDGHMRVYRSSDGKIVWDYDANRKFETVNGVAGHGGSFNGGGVTVVDGWLYFTSGYGIFGMDGNVMLVFGPADPSPAQ
jgi:polyvinyl alcohol dehydrogenase (cytochrome)